jgi:hypothetical protein
MRRLKRTRTSLDGRFRDGAVLRRRRPCRAAPRAAELHARIIAAGGTIKFDSDIRATISTAS